MCWLASGTRYRIHDILGLLLYSMMKGKYLAVVQRKIVLKMMMQLPRCGTKKTLLKMFMMIKLRH